MSKKRSLPDEFKKDDQSPFAKRARCLAQSIDSINLCQDKPLSKVIKGIIATMRSPLYNVNDKELMNKYVSLLTQSLSLFRDNYREEKRLLEQDIIIIGHAVHLSLSPSIRYYCVFWVVYL